MANKLIYFMRHGETLLNAEGIKQGVEGSLSDRGKAQAIETANEFPRHKGKPEIILSSPYIRAQETAEIVAKALELGIEYSPLLVERKSPSVVIGRPVDDREVRTIIDRIDNSYHEDNYRYSDEENFIDLKNRAKKLLEYLRNRKEKRILVITHRAFLKIILAYMFHGNALHVSEFNKLSYFNPINNGGLTIVKFTSHWFKPDEWKLITYNDTIIEG